MSVRSFLATGAAVLLAASAHAATPAELSEVEARVAALRAQLAPKVAPLLVKDADLKVFLSLDPLVSAVADLNALPVERRRLIVQSTGGNGYFWHNGSTWCNSYVELDKSDSLRANADLSNLRADITENGSIRLATRADVKGKVQVKFQFKGARISTWLGNVCPPGGGFGSSIGVSFNKTQDLSLLLAFSPGTNGQTLKYAATFDSPSEIKVTAEIGLQHIGTIGHPMVIAVPKAPIAAGEVPLLISTMGKFTRPGEAQEKNYSLALTPVSFVSNSAGISAAWKAQVDFK